MKSAIIINIVIKKSVNCINLQMDSEGEEQTLKTCNSSTGECSFQF